MRLNIFILLVYLCVYFILLCSLLRSLLLLFLFHFSSLFSNFGYYLLKSPFFLLLFFFSYILARNRRCKLLLFSLLLVTSYCLKFMVTNLLQRKLFIFLRIEAKLFKVELGSPALVSLFPVLYLPSIPGVLSVRC
ncbi:hypothetical protein ES319_D09G014600v1 [Gossypium barbadense]|uniref:Uncharacterized protein n=1 Tax=Gossypium barbadense TaxID=3634 RepID=A0A5J5PXW3_GOSBA|nr:hypothetical protein ES319_D09G014600v1 [Gossypium barbadense]